MCPNDHTHAYARSRSLRLISNRNNSNIAVLICISVSVSREGRNFCYYFCFVFFFIFFLLCTRAMFNVFVRHNYCCCWYFTWIPRTLKSLCMLLVIQFLYISYNNEKNRINYVCVSSGYCELLRSIQRGRNEDRCEGTEKGICCIHSTYASYVGSVFVIWHAPQSSNVYKFRMCVQHITCHITVLKGIPAKQNRNKTIQKNAQKSNNQTKP